MKYVLWLAATDHLTMVTSETHDSGQNGYSILLSDWPDHHSTQSIMCDTCALLHERLALLPCSTLTSPPPSPTSCGTGSRHCGFRGMVQQDSSNPLHPLPLHFSKNMQDRNRQDHKGRGFCVYCWTFLSTENMLVVCVWGGGGGRVYCRYRPTPVGWNLELTCKFPEPKWNEWNVVNSNNCRVYIFMFISHSTRPGIGIFYVI